MKSLPADRQQALARQLHPPAPASHSARPSVRDTRPTPALAPVTPGSAGSRTRLNQAAARPQALSPGLLWAGAAAALVGILLLVLFLFHGGAHVPAPAERQPAAAAPAPGPSQPKPHAPDSPGVEALRKARTWAREHPDDLEGQIRAYGDLSLLEDRGDAGAEARKTLEDLRRREKDAAERAAAGLDSEIAALVAREDYSAAVSLVQSARLRMASAPWSAAVARREKDLSDRIAKAFQTLRDAAKDAKAKGRRKDLEALEAQARRWGLGWVQEDLEAALAAVPDPPPPPPPPPAPRTPEGTAYLGRWEKAMSRATARDYAGALEALGPPKGEQPAEAATKEELAQDQADFKELGRAYPALLEELVKSAHTLSLRTQDGQRLTGRVMTIDADRVELFEDFQKPTVWADWSEVTAGSLEPFLKDQVPDLRLRAIFLLIDGDAPRALDLLGGESGKVAPKYWSYADGARARAAKPSPDELRAREIYVGAERDFRTMASREKAIEAYQSLRQKFKDTVLVRHAAARIDRRAASGKEYYILASDCGLGGTFALSKEGRAETVAPSEPAQAGHTWIECEFSALPSTTYRCWVRVGGCCAESMAFRYQATGLVETNSKTRKHSPAEPGGEFAVSVKPSVKNLKPSHPKNEPRKPTHWEWVELALPHPSAPGPKRLRLLSEEQGFGVAALLISATRSRAPSDPEAEELAKIRALDAPPAWAIDRPGNSPRVVIEDFEQGTKAWTYIGGQEFPGASGSFGPDPSAGHEGGASGHLHADFSGGGSYVGAWYNVTSRKEFEFKELRLWIRTSGAKFCMVRIVDGSEQCHQRDIPIQPTTDWQPLVLKFAEVAGSQHWGGPNDGKWHGALKGFGIHMCNGCFTASPQKGELWLDDVEAVLATEPDHP